MFRIWILCFAFCFTLFTVNGQELEKVDESAYRGILDNQLNVLMIENQAAPVISVIVTVKAGSRFETPELFGASHFLEHLLFNGTENRTQKQLYREMDEIGGYNNASTSEDYVNFIVLAPRENIEQAMSIQSDMLFNSTLPSEKFQKEKGIVIEEIAGSLNKDAYARETMFKKYAYHNSPYAHRVLGTISSIEAMDRQAVMNFYKHYYVPNNMILMAIGDFDAADFYPLLEKWYGTIAGQTVTPPAQTLPDCYKALEQHQFITRDKHAHLKIVFPAPAFGSDLFFSTQLLALILSSEGEGGLASQLQHQNHMYAFDCNLDFHPLFSYFIISASYDPEIAAETLVEDILTALKNIKGAVTAEKVKGTALSELTENEIYKERPHFYGMLKSQQLVVGGIEHLIAHENALKQPRVTAVHQALDTLLSAPAKTYFFVPKDEDDKAQESTQAQTVNQRLPSGLQLVIKREGGSDIFAIHVLAKNRALHESAYPCGSVDVLHRLLEKGPSDMTPETFTNELEKIGARLKVSDNPYIPFDNYYFSPEYSTIRLECLNDHAERAIELLSEMIKTPSFDEEELASVLQTQKAIVARQAGSVSKVAMNLFWQTLSPGNPLSNPVMGNMRSLTNIAVQDLQTLHRTCFNPDNLIITVVSSLPADEIAKDVSLHFQGLPQNRTEPRLQSYPAISAVDSAIQKSREVGKAQSYLLMGNAIKDIEQRHLPALYVLNAVLSSRINFQLRETEGLAYRIGSELEVYGNDALFYVYMGTRPQNLQKSINAIEKEIKRIHTFPPDSAEIRTVVNQSKGRRVMRQLLSIGRAYLMGWGAFKYNDTDYYQNFTRSLEEVDARAIGKAMHYIPTTLLICFAR